MIERRIVRDIIGPLRNSAGDLKISDTDMPNILNGYFVSVFTSENVNNIPEVEMSEELQPQPVEIINFSLNEVQDQLNKLNIYKATWLDDLHSRLLKNLSKIISSVLAEIYNGAMQTGIILVDWKSANITAVFLEGKQVGAR